MNQIVAIYARAANGVIGRDGMLPWRLPADLRRFKALTMGKPMIMGRKTFLSVGERPLPGRPHIIISRNQDYRPDGVDVVSSLEDALSLGREKAQALGVDEVFIAGGGEIYRQAMPFADQLSVTHVDVSLEGDTFFPQIDPAIFEKIEETSAPAGEKDDFAVRFARYRRR